MLRHDNYFKQIGDLLFKNWSTHWDMKLVIIFQLIAVSALIYAIVRILWN